MNRYKIIVDEIIKKAKIFLDNDCSEKFICVNCIEGSINDIRIILDKNEIKEYNLIDNNANDYEYPTLEKLYDFAQKNDRNICYVHSKGINYNIKQKNECLEDWRKYMLYFLLEKYETCIEKLKLNDTCGVDLRTEPVLHYSGGMWWANSNYLKKICHPRQAPDAIGSYRHKNEFWICSENGNHFSLYDSGIPVYERHLHRFTKEMYER